ncbi:MAG: hypothetical protein AB8B55_10750 [Mariniblastus sp.]
MCTDIFIGVSQRDCDLTTVDSDSGLWIHAVPTANVRVRELMELETIFEVGSFMGCTCGLSYSDSTLDDPIENHDKRVSNVEHLRQIFEKHFDSIVRIMTLEKYDLNNLALFPHNKLDLEFMRPGVTEFSFDADEVYELMSDKTQ